MAGTVTLSRTQQFNITTGELLRGGKLYFYQSGTDTPQNAFTSAALTTPFPNPYTLESDARVPFLWFADGSIKILLTDSSGVVQFTDDNIPIVGSSGGGGGVDTTDPNSIAKTGDMKWRPFTGTDSGWVRCNGKTTGSATSGATELASATAQALFTLLWNTASDVFFPIVGGRGVSAAADWAANKQITLLDMRGRGPVGLDDMGSTAVLALAGVTFNAGNSTTAASSGGAALHTLTTAQIPIITPAGTVAITDPGHLHTAPWVSAPTDVIAGAVQTALAGASTNTSSATTGVTAAFTGAPFGGGTSHNNMHPFTLGTWHMRL